MRCVMWVTSLPRSVFERGRYALVWVVSNAGADATGMQLWVDRAELLRDPDASDVFRRLEAEAVMLQSGHAGSMKLHIRWTSRRGVERETTRLLPVAE